MPDLRFQVDDVCTAPNAAAPQLLFKVRISNSQGDPIHSIALRVQVQIEPVRRKYTVSEQSQLKELFGEPERWSKTLQPLLWANINVNVAGFTGGTVVDVPVPCTFDFNVAVTKYIYGLEEGELPTSLMFSGTVFHEGSVGLQIAQIPWGRDANYRVPVRLWKDMMDLYYPNTAWVCLRRDVFERIEEFRSAHGNTTWEQALEQMLSEASELKL